MADWTKPFEAAYSWWRVPRSSYVEFFDTGRETERVDTITDGKIEVNNDTETFETATVNCIGPLDVGTDLLRCHMTATFEDGSTEDVVLGTYMVNVPSRNVHGSYEECEARMDGRLMQLATDYFDAPYTIPKGRNVWSYAAQVVRDVGITFGTMYSGLAAPAAAQTIVWGIDGGADDLSGSKLAFYNYVVTELRGGRVAKTDEYGRIALLKPIDYDAAPVWTFTEGINATFLSDATDERDTTDVCNKVIVIYESAESTIVGTAADNDPDSKWSVANLGYVKCAPPYKYDLTTETTQDEANATAQQLLETNQSIVHRVTIQHVWCGARVGDIVELDYPSAGISGKFAVRTQTIEVGSGGCLCTSELRRFERA